MQICYFLSSESVTSCPIPTLASISNCVCSKELGSWESQWLTVWLTVLRLLKIVSTLWHVAATLG